MESSSPKEGESLTVTIPVRNVLMPVLRELWGMPYGGMVEGFVTRMVDGGGSPPDFAGVVPPARLVGLGENTLERDGDVLVDVQDGHLISAHRLCRFVGVSDETINACEAAFANYNAQDRTAAALEGIYAELRMMNSSRRAQVEEQERLARMPKGDLRP